MKMQVAFRETKVMRHGHSVVIAVGVIEVHPEEWVDYDEKQVAFKFDFVPSIDYPVAVSAVGGPRRIEDRDGYIDTYLATGTLEDLLTCELNRAVPNDHHNADFVFRQTELPASVEDGRVYAFSGVIHLRPEQKLDFRNHLWFEHVPGTRQEMMLFSGRTGIEHRPRKTVDMDEGMRGHAIAQFLREPLWGFGDEAYGLPGTMRLSMYQKLARYQDLLFTEERTPEEQCEFDEVREVMRFAGLDNLEKDERYRAFTREMREQFPEFRGYQPMTSEQIVSREESLKVVIDSILKEEQGGYDYSG